VLVSDIPANLEVKLDKKHFFKCGDVELLTESMKNLLSVGKTAGYESEIHAMLASEYDWKTIAGQTISAYEKL